MKGSKRAAVTLVWSGTGAVGLCQPLLLHLLLRDAVGGSGEKERGGLIYTSGMLGRQRGIGPLIPSSGSSGVRAAGGNPREDGSMGGKTVIRNRP